MGKKSTKVYGIITIQQFLVIALALGYSAYLLAQIPTTDNTLSIICVAFTSFAMLTTLTGGLGNCTQSRSLLKCSGIMGIVCVITFIIIAVFSGLWYGNGCGFYRVCYSKFASNPLDISSCSLWK